MLGGFFGPSGEDEEVARERYFGMRGSVAEQPALLQLRLVASNALAALAGMGAVE